MTRKDKAIAIIRHLRDLANKNVRVTFGPDGPGGRPGLAKNSLTIYLDGPDGSTHHHTGNWNSTEENLIDDLYACLTNPSICAEVIKD
jgi:hypothetical protein